MAAAAGWKAWAVGCAAEHSLHNLQLFTAPGVRLWLPTAALSWPVACRLQADMPCGAVPCRAVQVCQVSGLIINDEESRLQDHYSGRNYK